MPYDRNGWYASENLSTRSLVVAGESFPGGVLDHDDAFTVLQYVATQMHKRVEPIYAPGWHEADDWGYYYRANANDPDSLSRHAFALAIDYNATRHPNGTPASANFSSAQIAEIRQIVAECGGAVQWGGDFRSTSDPMHFQIDASKATVAAAAARIRNINSKDGFDMAEISDLRSVVREELDRPEFITKVAAAVLAEKVQVTKPDGTKTRKALSALVRELWQKALTP